MGEIIDLLLVREVVPVSFMGGFQPRNFFRRYADLLSWSKAFQEVIDGAEDVEGPLFAELSAHDFRIASTMTSRMKPLELWHMCGLLIDQLKTGESALRLEEATPSIFYVPSRVKTDEAYRLESRVLSIRRRQGVLYLDSFGLGRTRWHQNTRMFLLRTT